MDSSAADNTFAMADHDDHVHVGYSPLGPGSGAISKQFVAAAEARPVGAPDRPPRRDRQPDGADQAVRCSRCPRTRARRQVRQARLERPPRRVAAGPRRPPPLRPARARRPRGARRRPLPRAATPSGCWSSASPTRPRQPRRRMRPRDARRRRRRGAAPAPGPDHDADGGPRRTQLGDEDGRPAGSTSVARRRRGDRAEIEAAGWRSINLAAARSSRRRARPQIADVGAGGALARPDRLRDRRRARRRPLVARRSRSPTRERAPARRGRCARRSG